MTAVLRPQPTLPLPLTAPRDGAVRPVYVLEVLAPDGSLPTLPGWTLRAWPVARLGDLTLQATPLEEAGPASLCRALQAAGVTPLGPVRRHA